MIEASTATLRWVSRHWPAIHARGIWHFLLVKGVVLFGGAIFVLMALLMLLQFGLWHPRLPLVLGVAIPLCAIGGLAWAMLTWYFNERVYRALHSNRKDIT